MGYVNGDKVTALKSSPPSLGFQLFAKSSSVSPQLSGIRPSSYPGQENPGLPTARLSSKGDGRVCAPREEISDLESAARIKLINRIKGRSFLGRFKTSITWSTAKAVRDKALFTPETEQLNSQFTINKPRETL